MTLSTFLAEKSVKAALKRVHAELAKRTTTANEAALREARKAVSIAEALSPRDTSRRAAHLLLVSALKANEELEAALKLLVSITAAVPPDDQCDELDAAAVNNEAVLRMQAREFSEAQRGFLRTIAIKRRVFGSKSLELLGNLQDLLHCTDNTGDTRLALEVAEELQDILRQTRDKDDPDLRIAAQNVLRARLREGTISESEAAAGLRPVSMFDQSDPAADEIIAAYASRVFERAHALHVPWLERRVDSMQPMLGLASYFVQESFDPVLAWANQLDHSGVEAETRGDLSTMLDCFEKVHAVMAAYPMRPSLLPGAKSNLAHALAKVGRYEEAKALFAEALVLVDRARDDDTRQKLLPNIARYYLALADHVAPDPADNRERFASLEGRRSDYTVAMRTRFALPVEGESDVARVARILDARSSFYDSISDNDRARQLLALSLDLWRVESAEPAILIPALSKLIDHDLAQGHPNTAEGLLSEALRLSSGAEGDPGAYLSLLLKRLKMVFGLRDLDAVRAVTDELSALAKEPDTPRAVRDMAEENEAITWLKLGESDRARPVLERILAKVDDKKRMRPERLAHLAMYASVLERYPIAEQWLERAMAEMRETGGEWTAQYAMALSNYGTLARNQGHWSDAAERHARSAEIRLEHLGEFHPAVADSRIRYCIDLAMLKRWDETLDQTLLTLGIEAKVMGRAATVSSDQALVAAAANNGMLGLAVDLLGKLPGRAAEVFDVVLRQKSRSALVLFARRNAVLGGRYPNLTARLTELHELQALLASASLGGREQADVLESAQKRRGEIEIEIAKEIPEIGVDSQVAGMSVQQLRASLPAGSVLAEIVAYNRWNWEQLEANPKLDTVPSDGRYGLFLVSQTTGPVFLDLDARQQIDDDVSSLGRALEKGQIEEDPTRRLAQTLAAPIVAFARKAQAERIYFAPDGNLSLLALDALADDEGEPLVARFQVVHLATGRDLVRDLSILAPATGPPLVVYAPDYDSSMPADLMPAPTVMPTDDDAHEVRQLSLRFRPLPATVTEGEAILALFPNAIGLTGPTPVRRRLEEARRPAFLHLATHGYYLPPTTPRLAALDPMYRSGLVLAGANTSGEHRENSIEQGLLTAASVATLDLLGTELVVLSACQSGLGDARAGEGVFGLRRAFAIAGVRTVVMSLWKVRDNAAAEFMTEFYRRLAAGNGKGQALRDTKLHLRSNGAEVRDWAAFILEGDPDRSASGQIATNSQQS